jgi:signal transduction histidine kinase
MRCARLPARSQATRGANRPTRHGRKPTGGSARRATALYHPIMAAVPAPSARPRAALGSILVVGVILLQVGVDLVSGRETARTVARLLFTAMEMPALMLSLSGVFSWSVRRRMTAARGLAASVAIATVIGAVFGLLYGEAALRIPSLRLHLSTGVSLSNSVSLARSVLFGVINAQMYFGLWALGFVYPFAVESAGVRALEAQQLRSEAELAHLRAHLEPHFLLNTLNAIAGLVTEDPREARRLLVCLGDLLRDAVQETSELQRLDKQMAWLRRYAQILEARHHGSLCFRWDVAPEVHQAMLPRLLLQPLVENAVKHGALRRGDGAGEVVVRASRRGDGVLVCVVEDNGPGIPDADVRDGAFGLQAVRRRLELEAHHASLRLESSSEGTRSIVEIAAA